MEDIGIAINAVSSFFSDWVLYLRDDIAHPRFKDKALFQLCFRPKEARDAKGDITQISSVVKITFDGNFSGGNKTFEVEYENMPIVIFDSYYELTHSKLWSNIHILPSWHQLKFLALGQSF